MLTLSHNPILELGAAYVLDLLLGDPAWFPHPVRGVGWLIRTGERVARRFIRNERLAGTLVVLAAAGVTVGVVWGSIYGAGRIHPVAGSAVSVLWLYFGLATRSLSDYARQVLRDLQAGTLAAARQSVGHIVGRDTAQLDERDVSRAVIESVAESTVDGIIAPLFFAALGGAPLMWLFKTVSTCDSMIGYKDERYIRFGTFGARFDDVLNYIPARLAFLLFPLAALLGGESPRRAWRIARRDHTHHASPNAGIPEAAMAGALGVRLGGPTVYEGEVEAKPFFGGELTPAEPADVPRAIRMMWIVSALMCLVALGLSYCIHRTCSPGF